MRRIVASAFLSLDGVMQAPGGPSEDWTGGFQYGGWLWPLADEAIGTAMDRVLIGEYELLLGRRTYEIFAAYWPYYEGGGEDSPIADQFNATAKHVLTRNPDQPLDWANSHRLADVAAVAALKATDGPDLVIQGSGGIVPALLDAGLIDRVTTLTFPVLLGRGRRFFGEGTPARTLNMVEHLVSPNGTIVATYEPAGPAQTGSLGEMPKNEREAARQERMKGEG